MKTKLFGAMVLAVLAIPGLLVPMGELGAAPPKQNYVVKASASLGIYYQPSVNGCRVTNIFPTGVVPFSDGSYLQTGDIIVSVGGRSTKGTTVNLQDKIDLAYATGNTEILVRDVNSGQVYSFNLP
jgi:hypothetical protein